MTTDEMNKRVWLWLDDKHCWHEPTLFDERHIYWKCANCNKEHIHKEWFDNPDFTTDAGAVLLLREMMKREDWPEIYKDIGCQRERPYGIPPEFLTTPGKLLQAVSEWIEEGREGE
jgi:hypothetical protein